MATPPSPPSSSPGSDIEKQNHHVSTTEKDAPDALIDEQGVFGAHMLDASQLHDPNLKTTADGKTILIPQPSSNPNDPLNWSYVKKHVILGIISIVAFMADFGSSIGIITLLPQAKYICPLSHRK